MATSPREHSPALWRDCRLDCLYRWKLEGEYAGRPDTHAVLGGQKRDTVMDQYRPSCVYDASDSNPQCEMRRDGTPPALMANPQGTTAPPLIRWGKHPGLLSQGKPTTWGFARFPTSFRPQWHAAHPALDPIYFLGVPCRPPPNRRRGEREPSCPLRPSPPLPSGLHGRPSSPQMAAGHRRARRTMTTPAAASSSSSSPPGSRPRG